MKKEDITEDILASLLAEPDFKFTKLEEIQYNKSDGKVSFFENFNFDGYSEEKKYHKWEDFERKYCGLQEVHVTGSKMSYSSNEDNERVILPGLDEVLDNVCTS